MHQLTDVLLLFVISFFSTTMACADGAPGFRGTFRGTSLGQQVEVVLEPKAGQVTGRVTVAGVACPFEGKAEGAALRGTATNPVLGLGVKIDARLEGDTLQWTAHFPDPFGGATNPVTVALTRAAAGGSETAAQAAAPGAIDPRLVGNWRRTSSVRVQPGERVNEALNLTTDVYCRLAADGTFSFGGAQSAFSAENRYGGAAGTAGPAQVTTGKWKVENQVIWSLPQGASQWISLGKYAVSSDGLVVYPPGGKAEYWERT